jgi:hypothetical protein
MKAAGASADALASITFKNTVFTLRLRDGKYVQFQAVDGGPTEAGSLGTIVSITNDTMVLQETHENGAPLGPPQVYAIRWQGDKLLIDLVSFPSGDDLAILTAIYESSPFTRRP